MAKLPPGSKIPKDLQGRYDSIAAIINQFCDESLNEEYKELCLQALTRLCRKRPSPISSGRPATWAGGIIYAVGSCNFIFDTGQPIHMTGQDIAEGIEMSKSTISNKAAEIKKLLKMSQLSAEWTLPSKQEKNPWLWMVWF